MVPKRQSTDRQPPNGVQHRAQLTLPHPQSITLVHALVTAWVGRDAGGELVRLALHEWTANLIQHAEFGSETPRMMLEVRSNQRHIYTAVEDNSAGFDLHAVPNATFEHLPERGMGLTLLRTCALRLQYRRRYGWNRLAFVVDAMSSPASVGQSRRAS